MIYVDIVSDTICPWCYIGKRRFERALALSGRNDVAISWRPFQLNPDMPPEGMTRDDYVRAKFGGGDRPFKLRFADSNENVAWDRLIAPDRRLLTRAQLVPERVGWSRSARSAARHLPKPAQRFLRRVRDRVS